MPEDARPIRRRSIWRNAVARRDPGLQMIQCRLVATRRFAEMHEPALDERLIPFRAILLIESQEVAVLIDASRKTRARQQHEREQRMARGVFPTGCATSSVDQRIASSHNSSRSNRSPARRLVAFVEQEIQRRETPSSRGREILAFGNLEADSRSRMRCFVRVSCFSIAASLREKRARDFAGAETAQHLQREHDLRIGRDVGMAADEHQAQRIVADLLRPSARRPAGVECVCSKCVMIAGSFSARHSLMAKRIAREVHRHARDPCGRIRRHAAHRPRAQRAEHRLLRDIFRERQIVDAEQSDERAVQAPGLVPEEMLDELRCGRRWSVGSESGICCRCGCRCTLRYTARALATRFAGAEHAEMTVLRHLTHLDDETVCEARMLLRNRRRFIESLTIRITYPPIASFASANGPSTTRSPATPETTRVSSSSGWPSTPFLRRARPSYQAFQRVISCWR